MFNPEKILAGLMTGGIGKTVSSNATGGLKGLVSAGAAIGLLGVAMEAFEHFSKTQGGGSVQANLPPQQPYRNEVLTPPPLQCQSVPPPPPGVVVSSPPPLANQLPAAPAVSHPYESKALSPSQSEAVLLIRAMIASANCDGIIDSQERANILEKLKAIGMSRDEEAFIMRELLEPAGIDEIVRCVDGHDMARHVYIASLVAITVDTEKERNYLQTLADRLGLTNDEVAEIHRQVGV